MNFQSNSFDIFASTKKSGSSMTSAKVGYLFTFFCISSPYSFTSSTSTVIPAYKSFVSVPVVD